MPMMQFLYTAYVPVEQYDSFVLACVLVTIIINIGFIFLILLANQAWMRSWLEGKNVKLDTNTIGAKAVQDEVYLLQYALYEYHCKVDHTRSLTTPPRDEDWWNIDSPGATNKEMREFIRYLSYYDLQMIIRQKLPDEDVVVTDMNPRTPPKTSSAVGQKLYGLFFSIALSLSVMGVYVKSEFEYIGHQIDVARMRFFTF